MTIADWIEIGQTDDLGRMDSPIHRLDARAKALVTAAFVVIVMSFPRHAVSALTPFLLYPVTLMAIGRIPAWHIAKKVLIAAPFALMVAVFNPVLDRQPMAMLGPFVLTGGWVSFVSIMLRFLLTVSAALALVACTGMFRLGVGLERIGVPRVFVTQLLFLYRYLFVVSDEGARMVRAVGFRGNGTRALGIRVYASLVGQLLLRAMDRADRVHRAMVARGFDGNLRVVERSRFGRLDAVFVGGWVAFFLAARLWNLPALWGRLFGVGTP